MDSRKKLLMVSIARLDNIVIKNIEKNTGMEIVELYVYPKPTRLSNRRHIDCFLMSYKALWKRNNFEAIIFWQQFIGIFYNTLCKSLLIRKAPPSIILSVIYKNRPGIIGKLYYLYFKSAFRSKYINRLICHSSSERNQYLNVFGKDLSEKIVFCKLGEGIKTSNDKQNHCQKYFFSGGSSNRDYETLISAFESLKEQQLIIACKPENIVKIKSIPKNVKIYHDSYEEKFTELLQNAYSVFLTIEKPDISAGQLVLLNAMKFGKSSIVTAGNCMADYTDKSYVIEIPPKSVDAVKNAVLMLSGSETINHKMSENAIKYYTSFYSIDKYAERIANIVNDIYVPEIQNSNTTQLSNCHYM